MYDKETKRRQMAVDLAAYIYGQFGDVANKASWKLGRCFRLRNTPDAKKAIAGQRVAMAKFNVGLDNPELYKALQTEGILDVLVPWDAPTSPTVYIDRRWVTIEAAYPLPFQEMDVTLDQLGKAPSDGFALGPNARGEVVTLHTNEIIHVLFGGETGGGKSWSMRAIAAQVANGDNRLVLVDGKDGEGLGILNGLRGQVGPLALSDRQALNALGWVWSEMRTRYRAILQRGGVKFKRGDADAPPHIFVLFDEFQRFMADSRCDAIVRIVRDLAAQGRAARIHILAGTQKPTMNVWGDNTIRDQFTTRIGFAVQSYYASKAIMDADTPRLDTLVGSGDAYIRAKTLPGALVVDRLQMAYIPERQLQRLANGEPERSRWPLFDTSRLDDKFDEETRGRPTEEFTIEQQACALRAAEWGYGRGRLQKLLGREGLEVPGNGRADRLRDWGRDVLKASEDVCALSDSLPEIKRDIELHENACQDVKTCS